MKTIGRRNGFVAAAAVMLAALVLAAGCKDRIAAPTQGFLEVEVGEVSGVEVFLDGESQGVSRRLGPLDEGTYTVTVFRDGFEIAPGTPDAVDVDVSGGRTSLVSFALELLGPGSIQVTATDEVLGGEVTGAAILVDTGTGVFMDTGLVTPATVDELPPGAVQLRLRKSGFAESASFPVTVVKFQTVDAQVPLPPPPAVLCEMFTYTTCSGCPESAMELDEIRIDDPDHVYIVEWHRRGPGWPLFHPGSLVREDYYGHGGEAPAVVIHGGSDPSHVPTVLVDSSPGNLAAYHQRVEDYLDGCGNDCPLAMKVLFGSPPNATTIDADVRVLYRGGGLPSGLTLYVALLESEVPQSSVGGNMPSFHYVVRDVVEFSPTFSTAGEVSQFEYTFTLGHSDEWDYDWLPGAIDPPNHLHLTAWIQSDTTHE
ncbi:hypothetical protein K8I85_19530, partial [bacterium]|nr:hypothetical protein [bacterium]